MNAETKKQNGQFFTKNSDYILSGFSQYIKNKSAVDPFAGNQDLISWAKKKGVKKIIGFDVDKNYVDDRIVFWRDSINSPQKYKFVITNPPYLHKNKADKNTKEKYFKGYNSQFEDLYQLSIKSVLDSEEGILIVPLNFLSAENSRRTRDLFFDRFKILRLNIFSEQVFEDTTYNVVSFYFKRKKDNFSENKISAIIFPEMKKVELVLEKQYNWQFGGEFINRVKKTRNYLGIFRLTEDYLGSGEHKIEMALQNIKDKKIFHIDYGLKKTIENNILFLRAIDSKNGKKIQLEDIRDYKINGLVGKKTSRNMAHLIFKSKIPIAEQKQLMIDFNDKLNEERERYSSYFLTNFRDNNRKRMSFDLAYKFLNYIYANKNNFNKRQKLLFS